MKIFGCTSDVPFKGGKPFRRVSERFLFVVHVGHKIVPDVVDRFHVVATLLHARVTAVPPKAHKTNAALDAKSLAFEPFGSFVHAGSGTNRIVDDDHWLRRVEWAFDEFQRTVLLSFLADQQTTITTILKNARLKNRNSRQSIGSDLASVESFEEFEHACAGELRAARRESDRKRIEHPARRCAITREHGLRLGAIKNRLPPQHLDQL